MEKQFESFGFLNEYMKRRMTKVDFCGKLHKLMVDYSRRSQYIHDDFKNSSIDDDFIERFDHSVENFQREITKLIEDASL